MQTDVKVVVETTEVEKKFIIKQYSFTASFKDGYKVKQENYNTIEDLERALAERFKDKRYNIIRKDGKKK